MQAKPPGTNYVSLHQPSKFCYFPVTTRQLAKLAIRCHFASQHFASSLPLTVYGIYHQIFNVPATKLQHLVFLISNTVSLIGNGLSSEPGDVALSFTDTVAGVKAEQQGHCEQAEKGNVGEIHVSIHFDKKNSQWNIMTAIWSSAFAPTFYNP